MEYVAARTFREAARLAGTRDAFLAGGTDLVPLMRDGLVEPRTLVALRGIRTGRGIRAGPGGATVGALALLANVAAARGVRRWFPALATACDLVGTQQIRNMATLGGNLCQRIRCWYFRQRVACHKTGGRGCAAVHGLNEYLAVLGGGPCWAPHPSDPAVALQALEARVHVLTRRGAHRVLAIPQLYAGAAQRRSGETVLAAGDVIEKVVVPRRFAGARQVYLKATQRAEWDFALVSLCVAWPPGRGAVPRLVLGGVAPQPWEVEIRETGHGKRWAERMAEAALAGATPLSQNAYKVVLARNLIREALGGS